ncbi:MAG TPA: PEP-CTERM sorting domain-containing protein [Tepidisphaeraceae bacterium]|nr:PEP-CTERM sorting domain-containing protein [Tepidisphaeraceae bacterium]
MSTTSKLLRSNALRSHLLAMAAAAALPFAARAATVDGIITTPGQDEPPEYGTVLATQNNQTGFGNNVSELNQALSNYTPGGNLELLLTGNLEGNGNGLVIFIDSKAGGAIAGTAGGGFNQFGSVGGARVDDWGNDQDGGTGVTNPPSAPSIVSPNFNPDYALEINAGGGGGNYYINIIDLTVPNEPNDNRDIFLGGNARRTSAGDTNPAPQEVDTYNRIVGGVVTPSGQIAHAFDNTNAAGVSDADATGAATAISGFEAIFDAAFLSRGDGQALRLLPFITSFDGGYLSNQFLPGLGGGANLGNPGGDGGTPLLDSRYLGDQFYLTAFVPTRATAGDWSTTASWTGAAAPNGAEQAARVTAGGSLNLGAGVTLGYLELSNAGNTFTGTGGVTFHGGSGAAILLASTGSHTFGQLTTVTTDTRMNVANGATAALNGGLAIGAGKFVVKAGGGTLTIGGPQANQPGASIAADTGTVNLNADLGTGLTGTGRPNVYVSIAGANAQLNVSTDQHLNQFHVNDSGTATVAASGGNRLLVVNDFNTGGSGKLDLKDNKMVVKGAAAASSWNGTAYGGVVGKVQSGYAGGALNGAGIGSSLAAPNTRVAIGAAAAADIGRTGTTFLGEVLAADDVVLMYTYAGDANLDGKVNGDDYFRIDNSLLTPGATGWAKGDFNYDGMINGDDYFLIDSTIGRQTLGQFPHSGGALEGYTAVPEPASLALVFTAAAGALLRRRR